MKAKCVAEISTALGRSIDRVEAQAIEQRLLTALRQDAKDRATWTQRTASERVLAAGARLASEAIGEARAARASLGQAPRRGRMFAQSPRGAGNERGARAFSDPRLNANENKMAEMAVNNFSNEDIADEFNTSVSTIKVRLSQIKRKLGGQAPWSAGRGGGRPGVRPQDGSPTATIEQLVKVRADLRAAGYGPADINRILSARYGMSVATVKSRLARYDAAHRAEIAAAEAAAAARRRANVYDLADVNQRETWFGEAVLAGPIPGEATDARQYGFALDTGEIVVMSAAPEPSGAAAVEWTFLDRLRRRDEPYAKGAESFGRRDLGALLARVVAVLEADAAAFKRDAYVFTPATPAHRRAYLKLINRFASVAPYDVIELDGDVYLVRDGADIAADKSILPSPENDNGVPIAWDGSDPSTSENSQRAYYDALVRGDTGAFEAPGRDGGRTAERGGGLQQRGRISGAGGYPEGAGDAPRGLTEIPEGGIFADPGVIVSLFEEADRSTPFHEFGHVFLETMNAYAARENAPAALTRDMDIVRRWLGAADGADFTTDQHERFARGFEAYLREGKAPSKGLEGAFEAFRRWLVGLYQSVRDLDVELDDDIRGVFDRLVKESDDAGVAGAARQRDPARGNRAAGNQRPGGGGSGEGADRGAGSPGANDPAATPPTGRLPAQTLARDPELKEIAQALDEARAEIAALERQGLIEADEAQAARADLEVAEKAAARPELLRAAAFCLRHGARVTSGEP